jgi:predicted ATP-grasp superfamily ATP-dependent carboligase
VETVEQERHALRTPAAFRSRFVSRADVLPDLGRGFLEALAERARGADVILPVSTNVLLACAEARDRLPCAVAAPAADLVRRANDKARALEAARAAGVPVPGTWVVGRAEDLPEIPFPAIVKLRDDEGTELEPGLRYAVATDRASLEAAWRRLDRLSPRPLVQERIKGPGFGVGVVADRGRVIAAAAHRRLRENPVGGGPSAAAMSVEDPRLLGYARALIAELDWTGAAMVEFKKGDDYRLMEVNPRLWGTLPLAVRAGVNAPLLACRLAAGLPVEPAEARAGVKLRFLGLEIAALPGAAREGRWDVWRGVLADLLDPTVSDGILDWGDAEASIAWLASRVPW